MLRMSKLTDYGIVVMTYLAQRRAGICNVPEIAERVHIAQPTVSKLLKALGRAGLVSSLRGVAGGYRLARDPAEISVRQIIDALEGPIALTECSALTGACTQEHYCAVRGNWQKINSAIRHALDHVSLAEMTQPIDHLDLAPARNRPAERTL